MGKTKTKHETQTILNFETGEIFFQDITI